MSHVLSITEIRQAAALLNGVAHVTPVMASSQLNRIAGARVYLKCENFQRVGAFKFRGAFFAISRLAGADEGRPIVTLSSGNHAQGIALSCLLQKRSAHIVMPAPANPVKKAAIVGYGASLHEANSRAAAEQWVQDFIRQKSGMLVHPYNDFNVMAGQGTVALEFLGQVEDLEVLLAPISGGGLLSGICVAAHAINPRIKIFACEPAGALDALHSVRENRIVPQTNPHTMAEGLRATVGDLALPILRSHVDGFFVVQEKEIVEAMRFLFERMKLVVEPSSAVALAPLLRADESLRGARVGVIVTGGNVDLSEYWRTLEAPST
jgi:threonine dehydratase